MEGGSDFRYVSTGHLVYASGGNLRAVAFDLDELSVTGNPVTVLENISHSMLTGGEWQEVGASQFAVSNQGMLVYAPGSVFPETKFSVVFSFRPFDNLPVKDTRSTSLPEITIPET